MKIDELMEEIIRKDGLVFQHEVTDSYKGELYGYSRLFDNDSGDLITYIDWSAEGGDVWIRMIETKDRFKRQGYASKLLDSLKEYFPNKQIVFSSTTEEGEGLRKAYGIKLDESVESKNGILVFRGGVYGNKFGLTSKDGGATFFSSKLAGALPYAENNKDDVSAYMIYPKTVFDTLYKKYSDIYDQFLKETDHPARYGKTHRPFWTVEHDLVKWLDKNGYEYDAIMFDENTGIPSYAVYNHSIISDNVEEPLVEAQYHGRSITLNKPIRAEQGSRKKFYVYVKNDKGNIVKVWFGDPNMRIKAFSPKHRKSFRARHKCSTANDPTTPRYWSCKKW